MHEGTPQPPDEPQPLPQPADASASLSFYDAVGGAATFRTIASAFYVGVRGDAVLAPMYPEDDLDGAEERLMLFLSQYWGGPSDYSDRRGHPRLRARHAPFHVNPDARDRWLLHMRAAVHSVALPPLYEATLLDYLERAAHAMVNTFEPTPGTEGGNAHPSDR